MGFLVMQFNLLMAVYNISVLSLIWIIIAMGVVGLAVETGIGFVAMVISQEIFNTV